MNDPTDGGENIEKHVSLWRVGVSSPETYGEPPRTFYRNHKLGILAYRVEDVLEVVRKKYPTGRIWTVIHQNRVHHASGLAIGDVMSLDVRDGLPEGFTGGP